MSQQLPPDVEEMARLVDRVIDAVRRSPRDRMPSDIAKQFLHELPDNATTRQLMPFHQLHLLAEHLSATAQSLIAELYARCDDDRDNVVPLSELL